MMHIESTPDVLWILGQPNFACSGIANDLRSLGQEIPRKSESEQAAVLLWMLNLYFLHGCDWRQEGSKIIDDARYSKSKLKEHIS